MTRQTEDLHCKVTLEQLGVKRGTSAPSQCDGIHLPVSGAVGSLSLRLHGQRLWFCTLHETHFTFRFVTKKKKRQECTLHHKFCNTLYCHGSFNISYMKALQGFRFTLVLNFKSDVGCFSEQGPNNIEASWKNMEE